MSSAAKTGSRVFPNKSTSSEELAGNEFGVDFMGKKNLPTFVGRFNLKG
jgi:hypothetical protein